VPSTDPRLAPVRHPFEKEISRRSGLITPTWHCAIKCSSIAPPKTERRRAPHVFYFYLILNNAAVPRIVINNLMHLLYLFVNAISINAQNAVFFFHLIFLF
jgi:hypothetical protein